MKIVKQNWCFINKPSDLIIIERAGRTCYKSDSAYTQESAGEFVKQMIKSGHHSVIEHLNITALFVTDRGVTHELVRHRLASYSQESTRYCNYSKDKFGNEITVVLPVWFDDIDEAAVNTSRLNNTGVTEREKQFCMWRSACVETENKYFALLEAGQTAQEARSVLPNSLKTEIVVTANLREWRHIFTLRCSKKAHPQIRYLMISALLSFASNWPAVFEDIAESVVGGKHGEG